MGPLAALVRKELIQFLRSRPLVVIVVWTIAIEIAICAWSITYDMKHLSLAIFDLDQSASSRELVERFARTEYFDRRFQAHSDAELDALIESGRATLGLVIPPGFARRIDQRLPAAVQLVADGTNSNTALIALGYADRVVHAYSRGLQLSQLQARLGRIEIVPEVRAQRRAWYNPSLRSVDFVVVSMLTLAVMMIAVILPAAGLAWEKEAGTVEQLLVMPFRAWELMLAKVVPTFAVSLASLALALWVPWWFAVPIRGSLVLFFALSAVFLFSGLGVGLLIGAVTDNLQQALLLSFFTIFPVFVISGTLAPVETMPRAIQLLSLASPLTYYTDIALAIFLKGVGIEALWRQALAMAGLGLAILALGLWRFRRQLA
ncbi:MAG TPA: ABC transporter permease [Methylomirabilota bacterium]|nr:ABC transporter permease [Methylomirabilota bacterium]